MRRIVYGLLLLSVSLLAACAPAAEPSSEVDLPLATNQPTFLFFYTDN